MKEENQSMGFVRFFKKINSILNRISSVFLSIAGFMIFALALITTYSVIRRYVFKSPDDDAYLFVCFAMLGSVVFAFTELERLKRHITVDYLSQLLPSKVRLFVIQVIAPIIGLVFCTPLVWQSWKNALFAYHTGQETITVHPVPTYPLQMSVPFCAGILCILLVARIIHYFYTFFTCRDKST